jgi:ParB family chromosome partitioning protein
MRSCWRNLQPEQQEEALAACWQESYANGSKSKRILLPVRHLREWIEHNILWSLPPRRSRKTIRNLCPRRVPAVDCPKRTGHNTLLFEGIGAQHDSCKLCGIWATASLSCWLAAAARPA